MTQTVYRELLEVMKGRGGPYAGLDIPEFFALVEKLFDPEEAEINNALPRKPAPVEEIVAKTGRVTEEVSMILERMPEKGLCGVSRTSGGVLYRGLPFKFLRSAWIHAVFGTGARTFSWEPIDEGLCSTR